MFRQEPFPGEMRWALAWIVKYFVTHNVYYVKPDAMLEMFMSLVRHGFDKPASGVHFLNGPCPSCSWQVLE